MKKLIIFTGSVFLLAGRSAWAGEEDTALRYDPAQSDLYRANEFSIEGFGAGTINQYTIDHPSGDRVRHDGRLGAGAGGSYFFTKYIGVEGEAFTQNTAGHFVDQAGGSLVVRFPIADSGLAPYVFGGGGHLFDPVSGTFGHAGGGVEYRFTPHFGIFTDARYVFTDRIHNYGEGRAGIRFAF